MQSIKSRFLYNLLFFVLIYLLMAYVVVRAITLVMTHDEAYSFYNVKHFWYVETLCTGNTHWLNFLAIKSAVILGLEKVSQLRWFTLLCSGLFSTVAYIWIKSLKQLSLKVLAFSVLLLNPFLIDYLSLARGYAAGLAFEALSILCLFLLYKNKNSRVAQLSLLFAGLSAIANFNFFYFFVAFCCIYFPKTYLKQFPECFKKSWLYIELLFTIIIVILVLKALKFITLCSNDIGAYGGHDLINAVFTGFIDTFLYNKYKINYDSLNIAAYMFFVLLLVMAIGGILMHRKHKNIWYLLASWLFVIMILLCVFNKMVLQVLYPTYRTALMFYPLIALIIVGFLKMITIKEKIKTIIISFLSIILFIHFISTINFSKTFDYFQQENSKECFDYLRDIRAKKVGLSGELFGVYRNYYQMTENYKYPFLAESINTDIILRENFNSANIYNYDYLVLFPPYNLKFYFGKNINITPIKYYPQSGTLIVQLTKHTQK